MYVGPSYKRPLVRESQLTLNKFVGMFSKSHEMKLQDLHKVSENPVDQVENSVSDRLSPLARFDNNFKFNMDYFWQVVWPFK